MKPAEGQLRQSLGRCSGKCMAWEQGERVVLSPQCCYWHLGVGCVGLESAAIFRVLTSWHSHPQTFSIPKNRGHDSLSHNVTGRTGSTQHHLAPWSVAGPSSVRQEWLAVTSLRVTDHSQCLSRNRGRRYWGRYGR